jgi:hypothetical protein
LEFHQ